MEVHILPCPKPVYYSWERVEAIEEMMDEKNSASFDKNDFKKISCVKKNTGCRNHKKMKTYYFTWENTCNQASTALMRFAW